MVYNNGKRRFIPVFIKQYLHQKKLYLRRLFVLSLFAFPQIVGAAPEPAKEDLSRHFDMSLSELLNVEIISASKRMEPAILAPGTISVIDEEQIKRFGFRLLQDALQYVPSVYLYDPHSWVWGGQRGLVSNFSQTLLLVNGREVNNLVATEGFISRQFGLHNVRRVEVIASPGSALYGANALAGVINMVTKDDDPEYEGVEMSMGGGSFQERTFQVLFGKKFGDEVRVGGSAHLFNSDEEDYSDFINDQEEFLRGWEDQSRIAQYRKKYENQTEARSVSLKIDYKGLYAGLFSYYNRQSHGLEKLRWDYADGEDHRQFDQFFGGISEQLTKEIAFKLEYQRVNSKLWGRYHSGFWPVSRLESSGNIDTYSFPASVTTSTGATLTGIDEIESFYDSFAHYLIDQGILDPDNISSSDIQKYFTHIYTNKNSRGSLRQKIEFQLDWDVTDRSSLISGMALDNIDYVGLAVVDAGTGLGSTYSIPVDRSKAKDVYKSRKYGFFLQYKNEFIRSHLWLTTGVRYDWQNHYGSTTNPRGALVWQVVPGRIFKLMYSEAYREPNVFELSSQPGIQPAKLRTFELNISEFLGDHVKLGVAAYQNKVTNFLSSVGSLVGDGVGAVTGQTVRGVEPMIEGKWRYIQLFLNGSFITDIYQRTAGDGGAGKSQVWGIPRERLHAGLTIPLTPLFDMSLLYRYTHSYEALSGNKNVSGTFSIPSSHEWNGSLRLRKIKIRDLILNATLSVDNITNKKVYHANIRRSGPHLFLQDGRSLFLKIDAFYH